MAKVSLKDRFEIDDSAPLPLFDSPTATAFSCAGKTGEYDNLVALICDPRVPMRVDTMEALRGFPGSGLLKFIDSGVVNWAQNGRRQPVLVFDLPLRIVGIEDVCRPDIPVRNASGRQFPQCVDGRGQEPLDQLLIRQRRNDAVHGLENFFAERQIKH